MKILVVGDGGREAALVWKLAQSDWVEKIYCASGNPGTATVSENIKLNSTDVDGLLKFALSEGIDLTVVGPEKPLACGIVDRFKEKGQRIFGPDRSCARLESSKIFAKQFMERNFIPTAKYTIAKDYVQAMESLENFKVPLVIKADGLASGKGVYVAENLKSASEILKDLLLGRSLGVEGSKVVIEEFLQGKELSLFAMADGKIIRELADARDFKRIFECDRGPNTGGMGSISPVPDYSDSLRREFNEKILLPTELGLKRENLKYAGVLYFGLINTKDGLKVLEYNCRFGDPEAQAVLPRIDFDLAKVLFACAEGELEKCDLKMREETALNVVAASRGYPTKFDTGFEIHGLDSAKEALVFQAGTKTCAEGVVTAGGRVLSVTALDPIPAKAREKAYAALEEITFDGLTFRRDIGAEFDVN